MHSVAIVQRVLPHYRISFFQKLHDRLGSENIQLLLVYGQEKPNSVPRTTPINKDWCYQINNKYIHLLGAEFVWQPCVGRLKSSNLVIIEQSNRLLLNYLLLLRPSDSTKLAYWGHGRNFQATHNGLWREKFKAILSRHVMWWFAYTRSSADAVVKAGFPREKITLVQNTIDTHDLADAMRQVSVEELDSLKKELGIDTENVCIYCGGIYAEKKLDFLIRVCLEIKNQVPDFVMLFIGNGPDQHVVEYAAREHDWIRYVGSKFGQDRASYFKISKALLMPGLVGLAIVDSFVAGLPLFTTDIPVHSPEIDYLESGVNGIMTAHDQQDYAAAVVNYLGSLQQQEKLIAGCKKSSEEYTLDNMVENYVMGIKKCLAL